MMMIRQTAKSSATSPATAGTPDVSKLCCHCLRRGAGAAGCNCVDCHNDLAHAKERDEAIRATLEKNPKAFRAKVKDTAHASGCHCKNPSASRATRECFEAGILRRQVQVRRLRELRSGPSSSKRGGRSSRGRRGGGPRRGRGRPRPCSGRRRRRVRAPMAFCRRTRRRRRRRSSTCAWSAAQEEVSGASRSPSFYTRAFILTTVVAAMARAARLQCN